MNRVAGALECGEVGDSASRRALIECLEGVGAWERDPVMHSFLAEIVSRVRGADVLRVEKVREIASALGLISDNFAAFQANDSARWR